MISGGRAGGSASKGIEVNEQFVVEKAKTVQQSLTAKESMESYVADSTTAGKELKEFAETGTPPKSTQSIAETATDALNKSIGDSAVKVEYSGQKVNIYRGGSDFTIKQGEIKLDVAGLVKPERGISLNIDAASVRPFGGSYRIEYIPKGLMVVQRGNNLMHFEIIPEVAMPLAEYQGLLNEIKFVLIR